MTWTSTKESLPGFEVPVFVYCEKSNQISGPLRLVEHMATEMKQNTEFVIDLQTQQKFEKFSGVGVCACAWFSGLVGGYVFTQFMPTHWTKIPELPNRVVSTAYQANK